MGRAGLEPARIAPYAPQTYVYASSTTLALDYFKVQFQLQYSASKEAMSAEAILP